jgi:predicted O-methyltransferase YrrM
VTYLQLLAALHAALEPAVYLEIGVASGASLALSRSCSVAIDPRPRPGADAYAGKPWLKLYRAGSDDFFREHTAAATLEGHPLDLAFIDGLHEFTQVARDLEHVAAWGHLATVVVIHDVLPRSVAEANRAPRPGAWTGDVWRIVPFLRADRPGLRCRLVAAGPTGVLVVTGLNPADDRLADAAAALDRDFPGDGAEYERLVQAYLDSVEAELPAAFLADLAGWTSHPGTRV